MSTFLPSHRPAPPSRFSSPLRLWSSSHFRGCFRIGFPFLSLALSVRPRSWMEKAIRVLSERNDELLSRGLLSRFSVFYTRTWRYRAIDSISINVLFCPERADSAFFTVRQKTYRFALFDVAQSARSGTSPPWISP